MSDLQGMFAKMSSQSGSDEVTKAPAKTAKKQTIEKTYQKKSQLEHILLRPDTYIGSVEHAEELMWIYDSDNSCIIQKEIKYVPGLYKIFDEILVNAADNKQRDKKMDCIKIDINQESNTISIWNNGQGIPVAMHKDENMYVPTMIFGHLLTSSNYNDEENKVTGGRNGYGAKLCNIFSTKFTVETAANEYKRQFKQSWGSNMTKASEPKIKDFYGEDFTKITFTPDLAKFKMDKLDDDMVGLMSRRAYDIAASTCGVKVFLNNKRLSVKNFKDYIDLYIKNQKDESGNPLKVVYEKAHERWEVALTISDKGFQQVSFVNSIATTKGGRHVDYVTEMIAKQLTEVLKKKNKGGINIKRGQVKNHMWIFVNCLIVNPTFNSQTKENMTLQIQSFGSKCTLSEKFIAAAAKSGIVESVLSWAKFKAQTILSKTSGKKQKKLKGIPKLEDANEAGSKNAFRCTLILTEGDSAKSLAVSGLGVIGRDYYGVFPLRGKLLNVREATHKQIFENQEINNLIKILGLQYKKKYNNEDDMKTLRYGKVMIMTDQDQDGSHIKGLLINFIHHNWPELLQRNFLEEFITPIVKATKRGQELSFYSLPEFEEWKSNTENHNTFHIKYYKGLGTSTSKEAKEYFSNMARHRIRFRYAGQQDDDHIILAFSKKHIEGRKEWLTNFMVESKRRKEIGLAEKYLYTKDTKFVSYTDFVNLELVLFSNADNIRSIPSMVDGVKPGQRKVLFTCFKRNDKKEVKVAQLAGSVAEQSAYHHGEVSLCMTIVNLAQNFVGSNNINLLEPRGQFGTRLTGGKDSASARYIFTKLSPLARMIFHNHDDPILKHEYDDSQKIEPVWYIPIIPMLLVNGADGIGTGWMTKIPNYNPREIVQNLRCMLDGEEPIPMLPWYKNFKGTIEDCGDQRYVVSGEIAVIGNDKLEITELPVGTWTQNYKESVLEPLLHGSEKSKAVLSDYKEYNTDTTVKFVITCMPGELSNMEKEGFHKVFRLQHVMSTSSMCAFDELGCLRRFDSVMDVLREFYTLRLKMYQKRKDYMEGALGADAEKLSAQARFIMEKCSGKLTVENKKRKIIVNELVAKGYPPDPVNEWKARCLLAEEDTPEEDTQEDEVDEGEESGNIKIKPDTEKAFKEMSDVKKYDYLLGMSMWMLTEEKKNELLKQRDDKLAELEALRRKTPAMLWRSDLDAFCEKLDVVEEKERKEETGAKTKDVKKGGKKKLNLLETMPSPVGRRVQPIVSDDLKKKIYAAIKTKEGRGKRGIKKEIVDEKDEFDIMVQSRKTLADKLGTPEEIEKKVKSKKNKDGLKQTTLNFKPKAEPKEDATDLSSSQASDKLNGTPKKRGKKKKTSDSEDELTDGSESDVEFSSMPTVTERTTSRRAATKPIKYNLDSSGNEDSGDDHPLFENSAVKEDGVGSQERMAISSDSENEMPAPRNESSDQLFDSLIGKSEESPPSPKNVPPPKKPPVKRKASSDSEDDMFEPDIMDNDDSDFETHKKTNKIKKKKKNTSDDNRDVQKKPKQTTKTKALPNDSNEDSDVERKKPSKPKKKKIDNSKKQSKPKKTKGDSSDDDFGVPKKNSDSDSDFGIIKSKSKKHKKHGSSSDDSDEGDYNPPPKPVSRTGRAVKTTKYVFDSEDSD